MAKETHRLIIDKILEKLIIEEDYTQEQIVQKFKELDINISSSSVSKLKKKNLTIGKQLLKKAAKGLLLIMERDFCLTYNETSDEFDVIPDCTKQIIHSEIEEEENIKDVVIEVPDYTIHDGRIDVPKKVDLYNYALYDIIEIGIRLKSFRSYFSSKRESAFLEPIMNQLEAGINFKCYIADANGNFLRRYIEDRANENQQELDVLQNISEVTAELEGLFTAINRNGHKGKMELYRYDHFPYYHASIADGATERGRMYVSSYLYGLTRANSPVIELHRKKNKTLYKKYWQSIKSFINSQQIFKMV